MSAAGLCVCAGALVLIIATLGCLGARMESKIFLIVYFVVVCFLLIIQATTGMMGYLYKDFVRQGVKHSLYMSINSTYAIGYRPSDELRFTWNHLQSTLHCCGVESYHDWYYSVLWQKNKFVPDSCCDPTHFADSDSMKNCGKDSKNEKLWFQEGCYELYTEWLLQHLKVVALFAIAFVIVEIVVLVTSMRLYLHVRAKEARSKDEPSLRYSRGGVSNDAEVYLINS
uniref:Tetraspanin n=1 Tax=Acrobeloides nanus TaxID=290746 RepID=A0A914D9U4_9BILA